MNASNTTVPCPGMAALEKDTFREHMVLLVALMIPGIYHWKLYEKVRTDPGRTSLGYGNRMRVHWCRFIISNDQHSILGVQSMRNELMWGSFLGITIFTALTVLVSTAVSSDDLRCSLARMTSYDPLTASYETGFEPNSKVLLLCLLLSLIFLFTLQYLRLLKHLSVFVGCSGTPMQEQIICVAGKMYNLAALFHWLSMRLTFLLVAAVGWVFGPTYCLVSSFITVLYLSHTDNITTSNDGCYAPQVNESTVGGVEDGQNPSREV